MQDFEGYWRVAKLVIGLLLAGLPVMAGLCLWRAVVWHREGDEAMSRSWADAAKSFAGMMVSSWVLVWLGRWAFWRGMEYLSGLQRGG